MCDSKKNKVDNITWRRADINDIPTVKNFRTAMKNADIKTIKMILKENSELVRLTTVFGTFLHDAADYGNIEVIRTLIEYGADINKNETIHECRPLACAAEKGHLEVVKYLYSKGAEFDVSTLLRNPLFKAIDGDHIDVVKFLIARGINLDIKYDTYAFGEIDALMYAKSYRKEGIYDYIKDIQEKRGITGIGQYNELNMWSVFESEVTCMNNKEIKLLSEELFKDLRSIIVPEIKGVIQKFYDTYGKDKVWGFALCTPDDISNVTLISCLKTWVEEKRKVILR